MMKKINFNTISKLINIKLFTKNFYLNNLQAKYFRNNSDKAMYSTIKMNFSTMTDENIQSSNAGKILEIVQTQYSQLEKNNFNKESMIKYFKTIADCEFYFKNYAGLKNSIENQFLQIFDIITERNKITEDNANAVIPVIISATFALGIKDNTVFWDKIEKLLNENSENLSNDNLI